MKIISEKNSILHIELPSGETTKISKEDRWIIKKFPVWGVTGSKSKYVFCERAIETEYSKVRERLYLHRLVVHGDLIKTTRCEQVDHIDRDKMNNIRSNLRICSLAQNRANVGPKNGKKYKGVFDRSKYPANRTLKKPFVAYIDCKSRGINRKYLGYFKTAKEAAFAYDKEAKKIYGEFAYLNIPDV